MSGAVVTYHDGAFGGVSLGMFVFVNGSRPEEWTRDAEVHEYGHCVQSLLLGPLYLLVIGLPSALWCGLGACERYRRKHAVSYYALYTESWANSWGAAATGRPRPVWADKVAASYAASAQSVRGESRVLREERDGCDGTGEIGATALRGGGDASDTESADRTAESAQKGEEE